MTAIVKSAEGKALLQAALDARDTLKPLDEDYLRQIEAGDIKAREGHAAASGRVPRSWLSSRPCRSW